MLLKLLNWIEANLNVSTGTCIAVLITALLAPPLHAVVTEAARHWSLSRRLRHLRRTGPSRSNMLDQFDPEYAIPEGAATDRAIRIKALYIHPVKSCGAVEVQRALLTKTGFLYDRCFALVTEVVDLENRDAGLHWRFLSQRTKPQMSQIKTELWLPDTTTKVDNANDELVQAGGCLVLSFADPDTHGWLDHMAARICARDLSAVPQVSFIVPLEPASYSQEDLASFGIHARQAQGYDMSNIPSIADALPKLKRFLEISENRGLKLYRCSSDTLTRTNRNLAPLRHIGTPSVHGYTDQQPVNINNISSVQAVSALLPPENRPLDALRFRANIWITGVPAYEEETWKRYRILPQPGSSSKERAGRADLTPSLSVVCRTSRCTMPNVDLETGTFEADTPLPGKRKGRPQPSTTLVEHRTIESGNHAALGYLGMHCVPEDKDLEEAARQDAGLYIHVGDEIEVLERGTHLYGSTANDY